MDCVLNSRPRGRGRILIVALIVLLFQRNSVRLGGDKLNRRWFKRSACNVSINYDCSFLRAVGLIEFRYSAGDGCNRIELKDAPAFCY